MLNPNDVEITYVAGDKIYDLYVRGRFKNFYRTFGEAALEAERLMATDVVSRFRQGASKGGKVR